MLRFLFLLILFIRLFFQCHSGSGNLANRRTEVFRFDLRFDTAAFYCDRIVDGLSCKKLEPVLKAKDEAEMDEALRIYNQLRHRMEERRNRYEDARADQRENLIQLSAAQYEEWITKAIALREQYLNGTIVSEEFLRGSDLFHEPETYEAEKIVLPTPDETRWRKSIKADFDFDPSVAYQGSMILDLNEADAEWKVYSPQEQQDVARGGHVSLWEKYPEG